MYNSAYISKNYNFLLTNLTLLNFFSIEAFLRILFNTIFLNIYFLADGTLYSDDLISEILYFDSDPKQISCMCELIAEENIW